MSFCAKCFDVNYLDRSRSEHFLLENVVKLDQVPWGTWIPPGQHHFLMYKNNLSLRQLYPSNSLQDMKQNRWTIKYRSLTYIYLIRSIYVSHWSIIPIMMFIHQIILKILSKITRPWNIGHIDLYLLCGQSLGHTLSLSENMTLMHQIVLEI